MAKLDSFVAVFPASFTEDGIYFLAKLIGWVESSDDSPVSYHLQHWCSAEPTDDPGGLLFDKGYNIQCKGDCDALQVHHAS